MVLDINLIRSPNTLETVRRSHTQRYGKSSDIDDLILHDNEFRSTTVTINNHSKLENTIKRILGVRMKAKKKNHTLDSDNLVTQDTQDTKATEILLSSSLMDSIPHIDQSTLETLSTNNLIKLSQLCRVTKLNLVYTLQQHEKERDILLRKIGNILHESVPFGPDDDSNVVVLTHDVISIPIEPNLQPNLQPNFPHYELVKMIDGVDTTAGSKIAGNRGYFLKGPLVYLSQALQQFALKILDDADFVAVQTPYFMNHDVMSSVAQLSQFDEELYKIVCSDDDDSNVDSKSEVKSKSSTKYLIATSEQPLTALHAGEKMSHKKLPIKYAGISTCFRKEAGRHGKDMSGIFRVHQFEKVEQFIICSIDESWDHLDMMLKNSTTFLNLLDIPYRVVNIASGELNLAAAKKYDVEGWFPSSKTYRELVSCSNCTDYHSRNLNIKYIPKGKNESDAIHVHMLNSTMCAITRMICVILENYQTDRGIVVPEVLRSYMPKRYRELIPFI